MPYFNHSMARSVQQGGSQTAPPSSTTKQLRSMPGNAPNGSSVVSQDSESTYRDKYKYSVSQRKLLFMRSLIRAQVQHLLLADAPNSTDTSADLFSSYTVDTKSRVYEDAHLKIHTATCTRIPDIPLMARIYSRKEVDPTGSLYLKVLRHLGRKHPKLVFTFDIFADATSVYVFQEYVPAGSLVEYLGRHAAVGEPLAQFWAKQLFDALDFLGDQAISHRNLAPTHLLVKQMGSELWVKLSGFQSAIVYWDVTRNDVFYCPCWPAKNQAGDGLNFQAPEVYGNAETEEFDPIQADIWSYGANIFYTMTKNYPYNVSGKAENLDTEIGDNIRKIPGLGSVGQEFLYSCMRANANNRLPFDFIGRDTWLKIKSVPTTATIHTPFKSLDKVKTGKSVCGTKSGESKGPSDSPAQPAKSSSGVTSVPSSLSPKAAGSKTKSKTKAKSKMKVKSKSQTKE